MTENEIPQSRALAEASIESLAELMSRDPEGYSAQDLSRIILALREQRARFAESEKAKPAKVSSKGASLSFQANVKAEDAGL